MCPDAHSARRTAPTRAKEAASMCGPRLEIVKPCALRTVQDGDTGKKTPGGAGTSQSVSYFTVPPHTRDTRDTRAHAGTRITRTNLTTIHSNPTTHPHENRDRLNSRKTVSQSVSYFTVPPQEQPQARSRPLPAHTGTVPVARGLGAVSKKKMHNPPRTRGK